MPSLEELMEQVGEQIELALLRTAEVLQDHERRISELEQSAKSETN